MTSTMISDCAGCRYLAECEAHLGMSIHRQKGKSNPCAPIIDAEKSNEALHMVSMIRKRTGGSHLMAFTAE